MTRILVTISKGFITNSSSVIHWFDQEKALADEKVQSFLKLHGYTGLPSYVGSDLWSRSSCDSIITTEEVKGSLREQTIDGWQIPLPYCSNNPKVGIIIYGDEYDSFARELSEVIERSDASLGQDDYN